MAQVDAANSDEAPLLIELYCKALRATGMDKEACAEESREEFIKWLEGRCIDRAFWVMRDEKGPFALAHFEREDEIITVVVRDDMERREFAKELIQTLQANENFLKAIPATRRGKALLKKCGFVPEQRGDHLVLDEYWCWGIAG